MTRVLFRFGAVYLTLYACVTPLAGTLVRVPGVLPPALGYLRPFQAFTVWVGELLFSLRAPFLVAGNSSDTDFHWVQTGWVMAASLLLTLIWLALDRRRHDRRALPWFHLIVRLVLAATLIASGTAAVIPSHFPQPPLVTLVTPVGHLSLSELLSTALGASTPFQFVAGCVDLLSGLLLVVPATAALGALIGLLELLPRLGATMAYDVGRKQEALHLVLMAVALLAPDARRLTRAALNHQAAPAPARQLFTSARATRVAAIAQAACGVYLIGASATVSLAAWRTQGDGRPRSALYGIWEVVELTIDGVPTAPAAADYDQRWRRVIFDAPDEVVIQRLDDSVAHYAAAIDPAGRTLLLSRGRGARWRSRLTFERPSADVLTLAGTMDGVRIEVRCRQTPLDTLRLLGSRFRWVRPPDPFAG